MLMGRKFRCKRVRAGRKKQARGREGGKNLKNSETVGESKGVQKKKQRKQVTKILQRLIFLLMVISTT